MAVDPFRSATSMGTGEDTSLAVPSDDKLRSGQRRVLDQVHSIKRSKSKQSKKSTSSPTSKNILSSPGSGSVFSGTRSLRFTSVKQNGSGFQRSDYAVATGQSKMQQQQQGRYRSLSARTMTVRHSTSQQDKKWPEPLNTNGLKTSRSDPSLEVDTPVSAAAHTMLRTATVRGQTSSRSDMQSVAVDSGQVTAKSSQSRLIRFPSNQAQVENKVSVTKSKTTEVSGMNGMSIMPDITMKEAVEYLSSSEESYQLCGASFIQHSTFKEDKAKQEVHQLNGIPPLVALLRSPKPHIQQTAAAALRNLVFKNTENKLQVSACGGIEEALSLLKETGSTETQKQLTGFLWNLSSADALKAELIKNALPVLTESVIVPYTCWSDSTVNNNVDPEVFYSTTGCMRNLSCAKVQERQVMRECRGLIDSIITYIQSCVDVDQPDDKSVENCACILHNLTYQLETEAPEHFSKFNEPDKSSPERKSPTVGCFSPKSNKIQERIFDFPAVEESAPKGIGWLYHTKTMQTYLSLLGSSQKDSTLEACCGALQNLTANKSPFSYLMGQTIVQKLNGLPYITSLLKSPNSSLQNTTMSLVGNLACATTIQTTMARQVVPELSSLLTAGTKELGNSDKTMATACHAVRTLLLAEPEMGRKVLNTAFISSLTDLSENGHFSKASKAASLLLYSLWGQKDIQSFLKKQGMSKTMFVNETTIAAHKSVQVIE
ncbi:plakophilin-1 [Chanos chanos]|uniref:Plakophilin-1 n=1 Tax=Chanos chanos TaxID=29144 RepID=A0A6J2UX92_CHACN|nr:plakophilin-1 [Chanos chanos]